MVSGNLTPIPQNSITKTTARHKKFSHISHNFVNKMQHVLIFFSYCKQTQSSKFAYFHYLPMIFGLMSSMAWVKNCSSEN